MPGWLSEDELLAEIDPIVIVLKSIVGARQRPEKPSRVRGHRLNGKMPLLSSGRRKKASEAKTAAMPRLRLPINIAHSFK
jgi:hypothetical protein